MKIMLANTISRIALCLLLLCPAVLFTACGDDDDDTMLVVTDVRSQSFTDDEHLNYITVGQMIRIQGSGLSTLVRLYVNGVEIKDLNPNFISDTEIIMKLPSDLPVEDELEDKTYLNSMRFIGRNNEFTFSIRIAK